MNENLIESFTEYVLSSMDSKTMEQYVYDMLYESYSSMSTGELVELIKRLYGPEWFSDNNIEIPGVNEE